MLSYGWLEIGAVFYSICSKCPPFACTHARKRLCHSSMHCQWCSGQRYTTLAVHTVSVRQCRAPMTGTLAVGWRSRSCNWINWINWIKVRAVCWPKICWNERRRFSRSHTASCASVLGRCHVERRKIPLIRRASRGVAVLAVVSAIDLNARVNEDEVCAAQLWYADRHHKGLTERGSSAQETFTSYLFLHRRQSSAICKEYLKRTRN